MLKGNLWYQFEKIGYSNDTTCINSNNLDLIKNKITDVFNQEGYIEISKPSLPKTNKALIKEFLVRPHLISSLRIVGLLKNDNNWIVIKTSLPKLLCYKAKDSERSILSKLAIKTTCQAFHNHVQKHNCGVLLEANVAGETIASGYLDYDDIDRIKFLNEPVIKVDKEQNFLLLDVPKAFEAAGKPKVCLSELEKQRKEQELEALFNEKPDQAQFALSEWKKLNMSQFERIDEDLGKLICTSNSFWHENNLLYKAYAKPEELEQDGIKLFYFLHNVQNTEEIWSPIILKRDYCIEQDISW